MKNHTSLLSYTPSPIENVLVFEINEALARVRKVYATTGLDKPDDLCMLLVIVRMFVDFIAAGIATAEDEHENLPQQVRDWLASALPVWRKRHKDATSAAIKMQKKFEDAGLGDLLGDLLGKPKPRGPRPENN